MGLVNLRLQNLRDRKKHSRLLQLLWVCYLPVVFPVSNQLKTPFLHFPTGRGICLLLFMY